jgi:hypothetical protein
VGILPTTTRLKSILIKVLHGINRQRTPENNVLKITIPHKNSQNYHKKTHKSHISHESFSLNYQ